MPRRQGGSLRGDYTSQGIAEGAMADPAFWRDLEARFRELPDPLGMLRADWHYIVGSDGPGEWQLLGIGDQCRGYTV